MADESLPISDLQQDTRNANKGTERGREMLAGSLRDYGAGRSILLDKNNRIIAGNKTAEQAEAAGMSTVRIIETDGSEIIAVKRTDLDLETDAKAKALAIADNRTGEIDLEWDDAMIAQLVNEIDLEPMFTDAELEEIIGIPASLREVEKHLTPKTFIRVLVSVPLDRAAEAKEFLDSLAMVPEIEIDYSGN